MQVVSPILNNPTKIVLELKTRPSILCVTHQMNHKRRNYSAVPYEMMNYKWYQQVLGQYKAILSGTWWYWVSKNWHCLVLHGTGSA